MGLDIMFYKARKPEIKEEILSHSDIEGCPGLKVYKEKEFLEEHQNLLPFAEKKMVVLCDLDENKVAAAFDLKPETVMITGISPTCMTFSGVSNHNTGKCVLYSISQDNISKYYANNDPQPCYVVQLENIYHIRGYTEDIAKLRDYICSQAGFLDNCELLRLTSLQVETIEKLLGQKNILPLENNNIDSDIYYQEWY